MNHYKKYGIEDFVWDSFFRQWVVAPTREMDFAWKNWLAENPEMSEKINQAKIIVQSLQVKELEISNLEISRIVKETIAKTNPLTPEYAELKKDQLRPFYKRTWFKFAASFAVIMFVGLLAKSRLEDGKPTNVSEDFTNTVSDNDLLLEKVNNTTSSLLVMLEDSSRIMLAPESKLRYAKNFSGTKREVYLTGEAFFDISKDASRPFFVYANELVTKVLGTSFTIRAYKTSKEVTVEVKTGRVSVFTQSDPDKKSKESNNELDGIVLSPNQKIIYARDQVRMVKTLVEKPEIIVSKAQTPQFIFEDVPATEAFDSIGKAYGIDILYDEEILKGCPLTAILENQTLHEKLTIICKAIEANYEILDGQVVIHGKGCKN